MTREELMSRLDAASSTETVRVYRDFRYGPREDRPGEGAESTAEPGYRHRTGQYYDLYLPVDLPADTPVVLYVHGGGWSQRFDKDFCPDPLMLEWVEMGWCVVNMDYIMQNDADNDPNVERVPEATFDEMLRDIDKMVSCIARELPGIGISPKKIAVCGHSAGAHLSCLYGYDEKKPEVLGLGLAHAIPVGAVFDFAGPTDLTMRLAHSGPEGDRRFCWLCGLDSAEGLDEALRRHSPTALITKDTPPTVLCYFRRADADNDCPIPAKVYREHLRLLEEAEVPHEARLFEGHSHSDVFCSDVMPWVAETTDGFRKYL